MVRQIQSSTIEAWHKCILGQLDVGDDVSMMPET